MNNFIKEAVTSTITLATFMKEVVEVLIKSIGSLKPQLSMEENTAATAGYTEEERSITWENNLATIIDEDNGYLTSDDSLADNDTTITDSLADNDTTITYIFNGFAMDLDTTQTTLLTSPDHSDKPTKHLIPTNDDDTSSDKLDPSDIERNTRNQTELKLHLKNILSSASDTLCNNTNQSDPNQHKVLPHTIIEDNQQWVKSHLDHTRPCVTTMITI